MGWLIGITLLCVFITVIIFFAFWRLTFPLVVLAGLIGGAIYWKNEAEIKVQRLALADAKNSPAKEENGWAVFYDEDPASGKQIARWAWTASLDGLCTLTVETRINADELTGIECPGYKVKLNGDAHIEVKFDNVPTSARMEIQKYSDSGYGGVESFYFDTSGDRSYSGSLTYRNFIRQLMNSETVAIRIPWEDRFWVAFDLKGSSQAINSLGNEK